MRAAIISDRRITGQSVDVLAELIIEVGPRWQAQHQIRLAARPRTRAVGAGAKHRLVVVDRLLATLVHLRHGVTHDVLTPWFEVERSTITRAVGEIRPCWLSADAPSNPACACALWPRSSSISRHRNHRNPRRHRGPVRRPRAGSKYRDALVSGWSKQNAVKAMVVTNADGWCCGAVWAVRDSCADIIHARQLGVVGLLAGGPAAQILADAGYQGLAYRPVGAS